MQYNLKAGQIPVIPNSEPQLEFLSSPEYEVLYGGAAGGGKTWCLVVDPLKYIDYSRFTAIIFRRTYPELMGSIFPLTQEYYLNAGARWNEQKKMYIFPSGATIRLGYMQYIEDWKNYQGHEYARQYFDELTNFYERQYVEIAPWCRSRQEGIPPRRRAASNPGGIGHAWVKKRFVDNCNPVKSGEKRFSKLANIMWQPMKSGPTYWVKVPAPDGSVRYSSRRFIPSRIFDNVHMLRNNPEYLTALLLLPERRRRALLEGDWNAFEGQFFKFVPEEQMATPFIVPKSWPLIGALDPGWGGYTSYSLATMNYEGYYWRLGTYYDVGNNIIKSVRDIFNYTKSLTITRGRMPDYVVADPAAWAKHDQHAIIPMDKAFADYMREAGFLLVKGLNDRLSGWANMVTFMQKKHPKNGDYVYKVFDNYNQPYLDQIVSSVADEKVPGDLQGRGRDSKLAYHCLDEERYRLMKVVDPDKPADEEYPDWWKKVQQELNIAKDSYGVMGE